MKIKSLLCTLPLAALFACSEKNEVSTSSLPLSKQQLEFEIYDSLVVDYVGNLHLSDISDDYKSFLLIDLQTDTLFVADASGEIIHRFKRKGEGPGDYMFTTIGPPRFLSESEIIVPAYQGFYCYSYSGEFIRKFTPEFNHSGSLINRFNNNLVRQNNRIYYPWEGRIEDELGIDGKKFQLATRRVEVLDLQQGGFNPAVPFPTQSKFSTGEKSYSKIDYTTVLASMGDTLYVAFRNEPVIYGYHFSDLESPASVRPIPFDEFIQKEPRDTDNFGNYEAKDHYVGSIRSISPTENRRFLVSYSRGLNDLEFGELNAIQNEEEVIRIMRTKNASRVLLFDGTMISPVITKPEILGSTFEFISEDEIWFTPDYEQFEKAYTVFYKTRLVPSTPNRQKQDRD